VADFSELRVWQAAQAVALEAYRFSATFPKAEQFGLTSQVRRAAVSIAANIAESNGRQSSPDQARFLHIAKGSAKELRSHLLIARDLGFLASDQQAKTNGQLIAVERMLSVLLRYHQSRIHPRSSNFDPPTP
jgi:four helix bundle protein